MTIGRIRLKRGVTVEQALGALRPRVIEANNVLAGGVQPYALQENYIRWVDDVERQLVSVARDPTVVQAFHTSRYWQIRDIHRKTPMAGDLVSSELRLQLEGFQRSVEDLDLRARTLRAAPGEVAVLDANVLLQYLPPPQIPWQQVLDAELVRLVVPLRVVEELDAEKYGSSQRLAKAARSLLPWLEDTLGQGGRPGAVRDGVTIEVPVEDELRPRIADADGEILAFCDDFQQLTGKLVTVVTADTSMLIRARAQVLAVCHPPECYERMGED
jgi:hypothetical protein